MMELQNIRQRDDADDLDDGNDFDDEEPQDSIE